ncbi:MAG: TetR/AcrR family transcriptional regulator [Sulfurospirillaceae bacterium]|nr:TetR/AcrR family transcriptional regulator [Sulfurospirillaceae bacterium]MDD2826127.1 TetR/AcrR family transcriptional regulator [Sulfurospirillaceae bacterium]
MRDTKERLIEATFNEVYQKGYNTASLSTILERAQTNKGTMYHYFSSKKTMVLAMIEEKYQNRMKENWQDLEASEDNIIDTLLVILKNKEKNFTYGCPLGNILQECSVFDDDFTKLLRTIFKNWEELFQKALLKAIANKEIKEIDVERIALFLIALYEGALLLSKKSGSSKEYDSCIAQLEYFLNTLKI